MPGSLSHVVVFTDDFDQVLNFLAEHARFGPANTYETAPGQIADLFGWPLPDRPVRGAMIGSGPGMLEVIEIPDSLRDRVSPGIGLLAVAHRDADTAAAGLQDAGIPSRGPVDMDAPGGLVLRVVTTQIGGLPFELVQFGKRED